MTGDEEEQPQTSSDTEKADPPAPVPSSSRKILGREFLIGIVANIVAPSVLAIASSVWLILVKDPSVPLFPFLTFVVLTIVFAYLSFISLQYFFRNEFVLARKPSLHLSLGALIVVMVTAPLALTLQAQREAADKQIQLYRGVTDSIGKLLRKPNIDTKDLNDLLHHCIDSIALSKPRINDLRVTVVFATAKDNKLLAMPDNGYYGAAFDRDMEGLYFDVSDQYPGEDKTAYRQRVGVAGWSYQEKADVFDLDVQESAATEGYLYKPYSASQKYKPDRAMICACIPDMQTGKTDSCVGVLSISSMNPNEFTANDQAIARFFATLLGRFETPIEPSSAVLKAQAEDMKKRQGR